MTREQVIETYLMNSPKVVAEMLYDTIERYEAEIKELKIENKTLERLLYEVDNILDLDLGN